MDYITERTHMNVLETNDLLSSLSHIFHNRIALAILPDQNVWCVYMLALLTLLCFTYKHYFNYHNVQNSKAGFIGFQIYSLALSVCAVSLLTMKSDLF